MRFALITLMLWMSSAHAVEISYFQSDSDKNIEWVLVDDCAVRVPKSEVKNICTILNKVNEFCKLDLDLKECHGYK
jgi:hypothetical protein